MDKTDPYLGVADALVAALEASKGDAAKEEAALRAAVAEYLAIAGQPGVHAAELGLAEYFAEEGSVEHPPALERVEGASEEDVFRWRELLADLADY